MPDPATATDAQWADYVFNRASVPGVKKEWWYHVPSGTWFIAERDVQADVVHGPICSARGPASETAVAGARRVDRSRAPRSLSSSRAEPHGVSPATPSPARCGRSGVHVLGRSFKYHRPRGVLSLANHDVNALVEDGKLGHLRADVAALAIRHASGARSTPSAVSTATGRASSTACRPSCRSASTTRPSTVPSWLFPLLGASDPQGERAGHARFRRTACPYAEALRFLRRARDRRRARRNLGRAGRGARRRQSPARGRERSRRRKPDLCTRRRARRPRAAAGARPAAREQSRSDPGAAPARSPPGATPTTGSP